MNEHEILKFAMDSGILDLQHIQHEIEMRENQKYLSQHPYSIWEGNNGKHYTYLPDENQKNGRKLIKRNTRKEIEKEIIEYWHVQLDDPTLQEIFDNWNDGKLQLNKISASTHVRNMALFKKHFCDVQDKRIRSVDKEFLIDFLEQQIPKFNMTAKAFSNLKTLVREIGRAHV